MMGIDGEQQVGGVVEKKGQSREGPDRASHIEDPGSYSKCDGSHWRVENRGMT